mmetsp:Transcript_1928/g.3597  ORF Transcript_1928/g.3597 Transcript_1928/m.3597 type:complete len:411 (+) Transcript_1928:147-1379(+)
MASLFQRRKQKALEHLETRFDSQVDDAGSPASGSGSPASAPGPPYEILNLQVLSPTRGDRSASPSSDGSGCSARRRYFHLCGTLPSPKSDGVDHERPRNSEDDSLPKEKRQISKRRRGRADHNQVENLETALNIKSMGPPASHTPTPPESRRSSKSSQQAGAYKNPPAVKVQDVVRVTSVGPARDPVRISSPVPKPAKHRGDPLPFPGRSWPQPVEDEGHESSPLGIKSLVLTPATFRRDALPIPPTPPKARGAAPPIGRLWQPEEKSEVQAITEAVCEKLFAWAGSGEISSQSKEEGACLQNEDEACLQNEDVQVLFLEEQARQGPVESKTPILKGQAETEKSKSKREENFPSPTRKFPSLQPKSLRNSLFGLAEFGLAEDPADSDSSSGSEERLEDWRIQNGLPQAAR